MRSSFLALLLAIRCCLHGQSLESATATLNPIGGVVYDATFNFIPTPLEGLAVLGFPFSAEEVVGQDGQWSFLRRIVRDSKGRTRVERRLPLGPNVQETPLLVEISDVVGGFVYVLDSQAKIAHRYRPPEPGTAAAPRRSTAAVTVGKAPTESKDDGLPQPPKTATLSAIPAPPSEKLGASVIEGVKVEGTRFTISIPVYDGGSRRFTTSEIWTSPELQIAVLTKTTDMGGVEKTVRFRNINRAEPDTRLFEVPAGYRLQDEVGEFNIRATIGQ